MIHIIDTIKNWLLLLFAVIVIILLVKECSPNIINTIDKSEIINSNTIKDSNRIIEIHTIDTFYKWLPAIKEIVPKIIEYSNSDLMDLSDTMEFHINNKDYLYGKQDSSLHYTITVNAKERPNRVTINYLIKEKEIKDYAYIKDSISIITTKKVRVNQLYYGTSAIIYPNFKGVFVDLDLVSKKGWQFEVGIGINPINMNGVLGKIGIKKLLSFRKIK